MPLLFALPALAALGGLFVGSQIDDATEKPVTVVNDQSKAPWWINYVVIGVVAFILWKTVGKKLLK